MNRRLWLRRAARAPVALALVPATAWLGGCASQDLDRYAGETPALDLRTYFNGTLDAYGVLTAPARWCAASPW